MLLNLLKQLHINVLFIEALSHMPKYVKFLKDLLKNKQKFEQVSTMMLCERNSEILQNKMPKKLKAPGHCPCMISEIVNEKALADFGANINVCHSLCSRN